MLYYYTGVSIHVYFDQHVGSNPEGILPYMGQFYRDLPF